MEVIEKEDDSYLVPRHENGYFKKGFSGNPTGKPKSLLRVQDFSRAMLERTFRLVEDILNGYAEYAEVKPADKLKLIFELWNRAEGRVPTQVMLKHEVTNPGDMNQLLIEEKIVKINEELQQLGVTLDVEE